MSNYSVYLPNYSIGVDCYKQIGYVTRFYGKNAVVIGGETAMSKAQKYILDGVKDSDVKISEFICYGKNSTYENVEKLLNNETVKNADMIFAVGGGRARPQPSRTCLGHARDAPHDRVHAGRHART